MPSVTVSVIIPCYNYGHYLAEAIESALEQSFQATEIIVVDDGSKDNTAEVAAGFQSRGVRYVYQKNGGLSSARNTAIAHSTGKYIALLDADDVWHPRKLELQIAVMERSPEIAALGTSFFDWPGRFEDVSVSADQVEFTAVSLGPLAIRNRFGASTMVLRQSVIEPFMPEVFDTSLRGAEDWDCWLRLSENHVIGNIPYPLMGYRVSVNGLGSQPRLMEGAMTRVQQKLLERGIWNLAYMKPFRSHAEAQHLHMCARMYAAHGLQLSAIRRILKSLVTHPLPNEDFPHRSRYLAVAVLRLLRLKKGHIESISEKRGIAVRAEG
jgi:glycosyltransferase involved in cell wall biosynthesis